MSRHSDVAGAPSPKMRDRVGTFTYILRRAGSRAVSGVRYVRKVSHHAAVKVMLVIVLLSAASGVSVSCTNHADVHMQERMLVSKCPTVEKVKSALQDAGHQGILLALQAFRCSGIAPAEEIDIALGERFARDPSSMRFVLKTGKMTPDQVGDTLLTRPYRLVDKPCATVREINKRRRIVEAAIRDAKARNILVKMLRVNSGYEKSVCK